MTVIGLMHRLPDGSWIDPAQVIGASIWTEAHGAIPMLSINVKGQSQYNGFSLSCDTRGAAETALADLIRACETARMAAMTPEQRQYYAEHTIAPDE